MDSREWLVLGLRLLGAYFGVQGAAQGAYALFLLLQGDFKPREPFDFATGIQMLEGQRLLVPSAVYVVAGLVLIFGARWFAGLPKRTDPEGPA